MYVKGYKMHGSIKSKYEKKWKDQRQSNGALFNKDMKI